MTNPTAPPRIRRAIRLHGAVQGVGLRPAAFRLARAHELSGFVRNDGEGALVEAEGAPDAVTRFVERLLQAARAMCQLDGCEVVEMMPAGDERFRVVESAADGLGGALGVSLVPPDLPPCDACLAEISDPDDRRYGYPFTTCTSCGPRFTVVEALPYDRARTTLAPFSLCDACRREYEDPNDRRFHAQSVACPACGPTLALVEDGEMIARGREAVDEAAARLRAGGIVAVKGVGGFALACDAGDEDAVARLRQRKLRPHKPFAVMARDLSHAERAGILDDVARAALGSLERPIVLVPARPAGPLAPSVAPRLRDVGLFLPPTPLQHLLLMAGPALQVMTSGNVSDEPLAQDDDEAFSKLRGIADAFLVHDRRIAARADDSVVRVIGGGVTPVRRARGFVPSTLRLPDCERTVLALGAEMKSTVCLARGGRALLSPHLGDLRHPDADALFRRTVAALLAGGGEPPALVAHDLHPEYRSTRFAAALGLPVVGVQHHHAHVASLLAEHDRSGPIIGLAFDGTGYGDDGSLWGGEALVADLVTSRRIAHLRPLALLGGERAIREPWRLGLAALVDAGESLDVLADLVEAPRLTRAAACLGSGFATPQATGAGRWFDAVAALCGLRAQVSYDGQAAAELEALAASLPKVDAVVPYDLTLVVPVGGGGPLVVDLRPTVRGVARDRREGVALARVAARFHETLARAALEMARHARAAGGLHVVGLTGGCFQNRLLSERVGALLEGDGFEVLRHRRVPCGDGGVALGQAAVASARLAREDGA